jgi:hypothetical protein
MKKSVLALVATFALASVSGLAVAQRGGGGHSGGSSGGSWHGGGGGGGWNGGSGWRGGGSWNGGSGWHGGSGWNGGWRGCWGCTGWRGGWWGGSGWWGPGWWGGVTIAAPWWGWSSWDVPFYSVAVPVASTNPVWWGQDPVFVQQPSAAPAYAPAAPVNPPPVTWFYCTQPAGYYPYVQNCSKPWMRVVPDAMQPPPAPANQPLPPPQG